MDMKTVARKYLGFLVALAGVALVAGAAAGENAGAQVSPATASTNRITEADVSKNETVSSAKPERAERESRPRTMVSSQIAEVVRMKESGIETAVIKAHIEQSTTVYPPSAEEIIYLHEHGVPAEIITAFIRRGNELRAQAEQAAKESQKGAAQAAPMPPPAGGVQAPVYAYPAAPSYPSYAYTYPNYVYLGYPVFSYVWPSSWWWFTYYPRYHVSYAYRYHPRFYHPSPVRPPPSRWVPTPRSSPWVSPMPPRAGAPPRAVGYTPRPGSGGRPPGGSPTPRPHR
jgi:hypothetical protein